MIRIPAGAVIVRDRRLTFLCVFKLLSDHYEKMKEAVKRQMAGKEASFAEDDLVIARLQGGKGKYTWIDPEKFFGLVKSGKITLKQFLACISVRKAETAKVLSGEEIEAICRSADAEATSAALYTELKPGAAVDLESLEAALVDAALRKAAA